MDPLRQMVMAEHLEKNQHQNFIAVEEGMDCREENSRFFSLLDKISNLNVIISKTSSITSCKLNDHEIVVNELLFNQSHETWAIGDRPYQKITSLPWNSHVRGAELLLSTSNGVSSMLFELSRSRELNCSVKLRTIHLQQTVTYFNLNNAIEKTPIDGHNLNVECNGDYNRIQYQNTKLLCHCNKSSSILPNSLIGNVPFELIQNNITNISQNGLTINEDDIIVCDTIFSLESNSPSDVLRVKLNYKNRVLVFETRSNLPISVIPNNNNNQQQNTNVTSSTSTKPIYNDLNRFISQQATSSCSSSETNDNEVLFDSNQSNKNYDSSSSSTTNMESPSTTTSSLSSKQYCSKNNVTTTLNSSSVPRQPSAILRVRVRISNFGISITPIMMTNYTCKYKFSW